MSDPRENEEQESPPTALCVSTVGAQAASFWVGRSCVPFQKLGHFAVCEHLCAPIKWQVVCSQQLGQVDGWVSLCPFHRWETQDQRVS